MRSLMQACGITPVSARMSRSRSCSDICCRSSVRTPLSNSSRVIFHSLLAEMIAFPQDFLMHSRGHNGQVAHVVHPASFCNRGRMMERVRSAAPKPLRLDGNWRFAVAHRRLVARAELRSKRRRIGDRLPERGAEFVEIPEFAAVELLGHLRGEQGCIAFSTAPPGTLYGRQGCSGMSGAGLVAGICAVCAGSALSP